MKAGQKQRLKRWLSYLLVFCMTVTCMEGIFSLGTWRVSAEDTAEQKLIDNGDSFLDIVKDGKFNISIYTWDTFVLVATNDDTLEVETSAIPIDTKLLVRFTDMCITDEVEDYVVYSMKLPSSLVPTLDENDDLNQNTWTELVSGSYVRSYGKIRKETDTSGKDSYYFQIYFVNTATQQNIQATFQYGAEIAEAAPAEGEVNADFELDNLPIQVEVPVEKDFTITKTSAWKGTESSSTSDPSAHELVYTVTITNNREDAGTAGVTGTLKEEIADASSYLWYSNGPLYFDTNHIYGMTVSIDGAAAVQPEVISGGQVKNFGVIQDGKKVLTVIPEASARFDLTNAPEMDFDAFRVDLENLVFNTLTISYTVWTYYGSVQNTPVTTYTAESTLAVSGDGTKYTQSYGAVKSHTSPTVWLTMKTYNNVTDARNGVSQVNSGGTNGRFGEVARFTSEITAGGEDWLELREAPLALESGHSRNYYLDAFTYSYYNGGYPYYFLTQNLDLESLTTADGHTISFNVSNKMANSSGYSNSGSDYFSYMKLWDTASYYELEAICQKYGMKISDLPVPARYYQYTDPTNQKSEYIWFVVMPETYRLAAASCASNRNGSPSTPLFADSSKNSAPAGYRIWVLGVEGKTLKLSYNKFLRSVPTDTQSVMNGSQLVAYNSYYNNGSSAYISNSSRSYGGMTKTGTLLSDGAILWELELDMTAYRELLSSNISWAYDGSIPGLDTAYLTEYLDSTYTLDDRNHFYDENLEPCRGGGLSYSWESGNLYYWSETAQKWSTVYGGVFSKSGSSTWYKAIAPIMPGYYDISSYNNIPDTMKFRFISTPTTAANTASLVTNTATFTIGQAYAEQLPIYSATDNAAVVLPILSNKTMDVNKEDTSIISSKITSTLYGSENGETSYLNGTYAVADDMSSTTATYTDTSTTLRTDSGAVTMTDTEAAKYVILQNFRYTVNLKNGARLDGDIDLSGSYTINTDGQRVYTDSNGAVLVVADDLNMYDGFQLRISGLVDAATAEVDYDAAFDFGAYGAANPTAKRVQLSYSNEISRDYALRTNDDTKLKATYTAFSVAVNPDLEKKLAGSSEDGYANTYTIQADVGNKALSAVYLIDQITAISEKAKSGATTEYTTEQIARMLALMDIESLRITAKNRLDWTYGEEVFLLENGAGQTFGDWIVTEAASSIFGDVAVIGEAKLLDGNVFAYQIGNKSGSIAAETYFEITYTLRLNTEKVNGETAFRNLEFYQGGVLMADNQAVICYSLADVVSSASLGRRLPVKRAAAPYALNWVAAGATVENVQYLKFPEGVKVPSTTASDTTITTDWMVTVDLNSAGKEQSPVMSFTDGLQISTGLKNDALNQRLLELLFAHMTVQITGTDPEGAAINVFVPGTDGISYVPAAGQTTGYAVGNLFTIDTSKVNMDYNQEVKVNYTTTIDWKGFSEAVLKEIRQEDSLLFKANFTYDDLKKLSVSYVNEVENADNAISEGSWKYPTNLYGTLEKSNVSADHTKGIISWDIHATIGGGDFSDYKITDTITPTNSSSSTGKLNNSAALKATELYCFAITANGETVYTYTGDFSEETVSIDGAEGLWDHATLKFYTAETENSKTLFELTFDTLLDGADIHLDYKTRINADTFFNEGGLLTSTASVDNGVTAGGGDTILNGSASGSIIPVKGTIAKTENVAASQLNESAWTVNGFIGSLDAETFTISDVLKLPSEDLLSYTSLKSIRIVQTVDGADTVLYDSETDGLEQLQEKGWNLEQNPDGTNFVLTLSYDAAAVNKKLPAGAHIIMDYVIAVDMEQYAADIGASAKKVWAISNSATLIRDGMGNTLSSGSKSDYVYMTDGMTKSSAAASNASADTALVDWTVDVHLRNYYTQEQLSEMGEVVLTDILPEGLSLKNGSLKIYGLNAGSSGFSTGTVLTSEAVVETTETNEMIIRLDLMKTNTGRFTDFRLIYTTISDTSLDEVQNTVTLDIGGNKVDEVTGSAERCFIRKQSGTVMSVAKPITYHLEAAKLLDGMVANKEFSFRATEVDENGDILYAEKEVYAYISEVCNDVDKSSEHYGKVIFDEITYDEAGVHYYEISELAGTDSGVGYDATIYVVKVEVSIDNVTGGYVTETSIVKVMRDGETLDASDYTYEELAFGNISRTDITVQKIWDDADDQDGKRPGAIEVQLYAGTEAYGKPVSLNEANDWTYTWTGLSLNKTVEGEVSPIDYSVKEVTIVEGYDSPVYGIDDADGTYLITNTHTPELVEKTVTKLWEDDDNRDGIRPESVRVYLYAGNEPIREAELSDKNNWTVSWPELPKYASGEEIQYTVSEEAVEKYTPVISSSSNDAEDVEEFTITNQYTPETTYVTVKKVWEDNGNKAGIRPGLITVQLQKNGEDYLDAVTLNEENNWTYTWVNLPKNEEGSAILYSVAEISHIDGYLAKAGIMDNTNTVTITNTITSVKISKVDIANGEELAGATIQILDAEGTVVEEWISADQPHEVTGLKTGEIYTLCETVAPDGYEITTDTTFVLDENGEIDKTRTTTVVSEEGVLLIRDSKIPEETTPEETTPEETTPEETTPEETTPEETTPEETTPEETTPEETTPEETTPEETTPEETTPEETTPEETTSEETTPEETTPEETEVQASTAEERSTEEASSETGGEGNLGEDGSGHLPITGMLVWPVTFLSVMGILLLVAGVIDNKRRKNV